MAALLLRIKPDPWLDPATDIAVPICVLEPTAPAPAPIASPVMIEVPRSEGPLNESLLSSSGLGGLTVEVPLPYSNVGSSSSR